MITFRGVTKLESPFDKASISILMAWLVSHALKQKLRSSSDIHGQRYITFALGSSDPDEFLEIL
jgi:hypothetical protein